MPELPEIDLYVGALRARIVGQELEALRIRTPSLLRTFDPPASALVGRGVTGVRSIQKRIVIELGDHFAVIHLMLTGRFQWKSRGVQVPRKVGHAAFDFASGSLLLTEQASHKRASLHVVKGKEALSSFHRGGVDPLQINATEFGEALRRENRTLKRALTDPRLVSGIGNAHSDEILLRARLSPVMLTSRLTDSQVVQLHEATQASLTWWSNLLREEWGERFPTKVSAFHPSMSAHGKYGQPCPQCETPIQRIKYANRETNYCPACQTGGKLLADRALSRLLGKDWPRTLEDLEEHIDSRVQPQQEEDGP